MELVLLILAIIGFAVAAFGAFNYARYGGLTAFGWIGLALVAIVLIV